MSFHHFSLNSFVLIVIQPVVNRWKYTVVPQGVAQRPGRLVVALRGCAWTNLRVAKNGAEALSQCGLGDNTVSNVLKTQLLLISGSWFVSYLGLKLPHQQTQYMEEPKQDKSLSSQHDQIAILYA